MDGLTRLSIEVDLEMKAQIAVQTLNGQGESAQYGNMRVIHMKAFKRRNADIGLSACLYHETR